MVPHVQAELSRRFRDSKLDTCPFVNLTLKKSNVWPENELLGCGWVKPELVAQIEFAEWTSDGLLRDCRFVGLRDDKDPREVRREQ